MWKIIRIGRRGDKPAKIARRNSPKLKAQHDPSHSVITATAVEDAQAESISQTVAGDSGLLQDRSPHLGDEVAETCTEADAAAEEEDAPANSTPEDRMEVPQSSVEYGGAEEEMATDDELERQDQAPLAEGEEPVIIDEETAAALREEVYLTFSGEDADDYTPGPARFVFASDGVNNCAALLMTMELSSTIQRAVQAQRAFAYAEEMNMREKDVTFQFELDLKKSIRRHEFKLRALSESDEQHENVGTKAIQDELEKLRLLLANTQAHQQVLKARLTTQADNLRQIQGELTQILENTFTAAQLVASDEPQQLPDLPALNVDEEYKKLCKAIQEDEGMEVASVPSLHDCDDHLKPLPQSPEDQARSDLCNTYYRAKETLAQAQKAFDLRDETRARAKHEIREAALRGEEVDIASSDGFDVQWVVRYQELTHDLIEAETSLAEAKAALIAASIDLQEEDRQSGFLDDVDDGYRMSFEAEMIAAVPEELVTDWMQSMPSPAPTASWQPGREEVDIDGWASRPVWMKDSGSVVAWEPDRHQIDKWRQLCGFGVDAVEDEQCEEGF